MSEEDIVQGCVKHDSQCQKLLYESYSNQVLAICNRYAATSEEANELFWFGVKNIFDHIKTYVEENEKRKSGVGVMPLQTWIKREIVLAAAQLMHRGKKQHFVSSTINTRDVQKITTEEISDEAIMQKASPSTIFQALRTLTPLYRTVYNMYELDNYSYEEISKILDVSEYISKDSLLKAKFNLKKSIIKIISL